MKEIAQAILSAELKDPARWFEDAHYAALQRHVFRGGVWDGKPRAHHRQQHALQQEHAEALRAPEHDF